MRERIIDDAAPRRRRERRGPHALAGAARSRRRHRHQHHRRVLLRAAARVPARGRPRPRLHRRRRDRVGASRRGRHRSRAWRGAAPSPRSDPAVALVLTRITPPRLRVALAHLVDRRLVARSGLRPLHRARGRADAGGADGAGGGALPRRAAGAARRAAGVPRRGPGRASALRPHRRRSPRHLARARSTIRPRSRRWSRRCASTSRPRPNTPRLRPPNGYKKEQAVSEAGWKRHAQATKHGAPAVFAALQGYARDLNVLLSRGVAAGLRGDPRRAPAHAGRARRRRLSRAARARGRPAAADGRVLAEPLPPRVALSPRAGRRVPGHQPPAVAAGVAARRSRGARASAWCTRRRCCRRCSSSAIASSRSTASATPT